MKPRHQSQFKPIFKTIPIITILCFVISNSAFAIPDRPTHLRSPQISQNDPFREKLIFELSNEQVGVYIKENVPEWLKGATQEEREAKLRKAVRESRIEHRIGYDSEAYVIPVKGLFKNTGQLAHIGLEQSYRLPVIFIDEGFKNNDTVIGHELDEISRWNNLRSTLIKMGQLGKQESLRSWMKKNSDLAQRIAQEFHEKANELYNVTPLFKEKKGVIDHTSIQTLLAMFANEPSTPNLAAKRNNPPKGFRTFMEYCTTSLGKDFASIDELGLFMMWPLYLFEVDGIFAEAADYQQAYRNFYNSNSRHLTEEKVKPSSTKAYAPIIKKPFSNLKEVKDVLSVPYEWSIDFLPNPDQWKGPNLYGFILCLMDDGQLHMSVYDNNGVIREFNTDKETEEALRTIGIIGSEGMLILIRSSSDERLKHNAVLGIGSRISLGGHSHPQGSSVTPSQTGRIGAPADVELFSLRLTGLPKGFPVVQEPPALAVREQEALNDRSGRKDQAEAEGKSPVIPDENLTNILERYIKRLEDYAETQTARASPLPINEFILYLKVLKAMYGETIGKYEGTRYDHKYVHTDRAEFAGELAYNPRFQEDARRMLQASFEGAFRVLAEQFAGSMDSSSSLEEMMSIMTQLIEECSVHPELREGALAIINDPRAYGLDEIDFINTDLDKVTTRISGGEAQPPKKIRDSIRAIAKRITGRDSMRDKKETLPGEEILVAQPREPVPANVSGGISPVISNAMDIATISDRLITAAEKGKSSLKDELRPSLEDVVRARTKRLLILADGCANNDPDLAVTTLKEYQRLLKMFGDRVDFYCAVTLDRHANIMTSQNLRPTLIEIARSIPEREDRLNMLTEVARQLIKEGDVQGALDLLEEVGSATFYTFSVALGQLADLLLSSKESNKGMIEQLERIIDNIPVARRGRDESKVRLLVKLGNEYSQLGKDEKARSCYEKAWEASEIVKQPAVTRLAYLVPVMREKGIQFPLSRSDIIAEARRIGEAEILKDSLSGRPDTIILVAREHAFNRDYDEAEECAQFINEHMDYPRDHFDAVYGAIIEAAALYGDNDKISYAASKMTAYVKDHFERAAELLVERREYQKAMDLGNRAMEQGYIGSSTVGYWGSTQLRIARNVLKQDDSQIEMVRGYLEAAVAKGIGSHDLEDMVSLLLEYPALDPDGQFILRIFKIAFEQNLSFVTHASHRIILQNLRSIILAKVKKIDPSLLGMPDMGGRIDRVLLPPGSPSVFSIGIGDVGSFLSTLKNHLAGNPQETYVLALDTGLSSGEDLSQVINTLSGLSGKEGFNNLLVIKGDRQYLVQEIQKRDVNFSNVIVMTKDENQNYFSELLLGQSKPWIFGLEDTEGNNYIPLLETITLAVDVVFNGNLEEINLVYTQITDKQLTQQEITSIREKRIFNILPKPYKLTPEEVQETYRSISKALREA